MGEEKVQKELKSSRLESCKSLERQSDLGSTRERDHPGGPLCCYTLIKKEMQQEGRGGGRTCQKVKFNTMQVEKEKA